MRPSVYVDACTPGTSSRIVQGRAALAWPEQMAIPATMSLLRRHWFKPPLVRHLSSATSTDRSSWADTTSRLLHQMEPTQPELAPTSPGDLAKPLADVVKPLVNPPLPGHTEYDWSKLISVKSMSRGDIEYALKYATEIGEASAAGGKWRTGAAKQLNVLEGRVLANLFFEPSTRTSSSFATAMVSRLSRTKCPCSSLLLATYRTAPHGRHVPQPQP